MIQIEVLKNGLIIGGRRYNDGDILEPSHHTHDVLQAVDQKTGPLKNWLKRRRVAAPVKADARVAESAPAASGSDPAAGSEGGGAA